MKTEIRIENVMACGCRGSIHRGLAAVQGVYGVSVDPLSGRVTVEHTEEVDRARLERRLGEMGYRVLPQEKQPAV
ncbi:heavy-metal-associated domain-containing protein [Gallalistipes aquisgranensis]|uniref:heavy-metal-associated domain-containing protein n=1 Tax=Gallalistipes aquisgranensis TaxID=2779358 RepID=UPI001CF92DF0|nr:heavy metal-associated domain-containing protein [Gallalistipes aquisgranensis]MBE5032446.1 heavy-metal-associated domain-containing protein [Gallalistipes aquisgranensis]